VHSESQKFALRATPLISYWDSSALVKLYVQGLILRVPSVDGRGKQRDDCVACAA
jgi:hypothetical protein